LTDEKSDQRNGLILTGVFWSWLATNTNSVPENIQVFVVFLPPCIMAFFCHRLSHIDKTIGVITEYTRKLELLFAVPDDYGWERWLANRRSSTANDFNLSPVSKTFWYYCFLLIVFPE